MTEHVEIGEQEIAAFGFWIDSLSAGEVRNLDPVLARGVLEHFGADFEKPPADLEQLASYTNKDKRAGLDAVWGHETVAEHWKAIDNAVVKIESKDGRRPLPTVFAPTESDPTRRVKYSGMRAFVGELSGLAAGVIGPEDFLKNLGQRIAAGQLSKKGEKREGYGPKLSSIPPEFPRMFLDYLKSDSLD